MSNKTLISTALKYWLRRLVLSLPKRLWFGTMIALITALFGLALLGLSGWFISATALAGIAIGLGLVVSFDVFLPGGGIRFFALGRTVSRYLERLYNHDTVLRQLALARHQLFVGLTQRPIKDLHATSNSEWLSRLTVDLDTLDSLSLRLVYPPLVALVSLLVLTGVAAVFSATLAMGIGLVFLPLVIWVLKHLIIQTRTYAQAYASELNQARQYVIQHFMGGLELQSARQQATHAEPLQHFNHTIQQAQMQLSRVILNSQWAMNVLHGMLLIATVAIGLTSVNAGLFSGPVAVLLMLAVYGLTEVLLALPMQLGQWGKTEYAANRLYAMTIQDPSKSMTMSHSPHTATINTSAEGALSVLSLRITQHERLPASWKQPLSLELSGQQMLWIIGRSGSGKSTIATLLAATELSPSHPLFLNQVPITAEHVNAYQRQIAYLQQDNTVLAASVFDNLTLGLQSIDEAMLWRVLDELELTAWVDSLPQGLNTWLGDQGEALSGGQARRLCLARVRLRDEAQLVILDEPFNGLDKAMSQRIWYAIQPWLRQRQSVILMHEQAEFCPDTAHCINLDR